MKARINGESVEIREGATVEEFLGARKIDFAAVVVEYNGKILKRQEWGAVAVRENDTLEIVSFVGGG